MERAVAKEGNGVLRGRPLHEHGCGNFFDNPECGAGALTAQSMLRRDNQCDVNASPGW
jgi:hypothetical protein